MLQPDALKYRFFDVISDQYNTLINQIWRITIVTNIDKSHIDISRILFLSEYIYVFSSIPIIVLFNMYIHFSLIITIQLNDRCGRINYVRYLNILVKRRIHEIIISIEHIE